MNSQEILASWDAQQSAYIAHREGRFDAILDVLELKFGSEPITVVDLACGPGSLGARILDRFASARVIGVDYDPSLLELARRTTRHPSRSTFLDADLTDSSWLDDVREMADGPVHAAVSTTALHWLLPPQLVQLYSEVHELLAGGIFLNGDHFRFDDRTPHAADWAGRHDDRTQQRAFDSGALQWSSWWDALAEEPGMTDLLAERERRFSSRTSSPPTTVEFQLAALKQAGFVESGTVWQLFDDYVVYGVR